MDFIINDILYIWNLIKDYSNSGFQADLHTLKTYKDFLIDHWYLTPFVTYALGRIIWPIITLICLIRPLYYLAQIIYFKAINGFRKSSYIIKKISKMIKVKLAKIRSKKTTQLDLFK